MNKIKSYLIFIGMICYSSLHSQDLDLAWAVSMGNIGYEETFDVTTDNKGNVYSVGTFTGTVDFDPSTDIRNLISFGDRDGFIQKLDKEGDLVWAKSFGGINIDVANAIRIDKDGNVYVVGYYQNTANFEPDTIGSGVTLTSNAFADVFIQKLDSNGTLIWVKSMGGTAHDEATSLALDNFGNLYVAGFFNNIVDFDLGTGTSYVSSNGGSDAFIQKIDNDGNFKWVKTIGGSQKDEIESVTVDTSGNVYITGFFRSIVDFDPGPVIQNISSNGDDDIFIQKFDSSGNYQWVRTFGDIDKDRAESLVCDKLGNIFIGGFFEGTVDFDGGIGVTNMTSNGSYDAFIQKLDINGNFQWVKTFGGTDYDDVYSIASDELGNVYLTGYFRNIVDFNPGSGVFNLTSAGGYDVFTMRLNNDGNFSWATSMGDNDYDVGRAITVDENRNIYTVGGFTGTLDFDPNIGVTTLSAFDTDGFVQKLGQIPCVTTVDSHTVCGHFTWIDGKRIQRVTLMLNTHLLVQVVVIRLYNST